MTDIVCETTFDLNVEPAEAWKALEAISIARRDPGAGDQWWLPGWESSAVEVERVEGARLTSRKLLPPCEETIIEVTFEHVDTGTRVRVTQSGFDPAFLAFAGDSFFTHADHIFRDLQLFFETGVIAERAWRPWAFLGLGLEQGGAALRVTSVANGSWARGLGIDVGDLLLTIADAPMFELADVALMERVAVSGEMLRATWISGGARRVGEHQA